MAMKSSDQATGESSSRLIDQRIGDLEGWRGEALARMRVSPAGRSGAGLHKPAAQTRQLPGEYSSRGSKTTPCYTSLRP